MENRPQPYQEYFLKVGAKLSFYIDWEDSISLRWPGAGRLATQGVTVRPSQATGYEYRCSTTGYTADDEPAWPQTGTVQDGSAVWTPQAVSSASLVAAISGTPSWAIDSSSGIVLTNASLNGYVAGILADATDGVAPGDYDLICTLMLADSTQRPGTWRLKLR